MKKLKGIDISEHQEGLDYTALAKQIDFVILREGCRQRKDYMFETHLNAFRALKTPIMGVYHFIYALNDKQAKQEAESCIRNVEAAGLPKTTYIWADFEYDSVDNGKRNGVILGSTACNLFTKIFCDTVKAAGYPTGIYTNLDYAKHMYTADMLKQYPIWLAHYDVDKPAYECPLWQYGKRKFNGASDKLDADYWYVAEEAKKQEEKEVEEELTSGDERMLIKTEAEAIDKVVEIAEAEVGYHEKASAANLDSKTANSGSNNYTKYGKEMHSVQPSNMDYPAAWCDCFVDWCMYTAFGLNLARKILCGTFDDYTVYSANMYKQAGRWTTTAHRGDQIFFKNSSGICHTGLVVKVSSGIVYTIEGNTSNAVRRKQYYIYDSSIAGYGRPKYNLAVGITETKPVDPPTNSNSGSTLNKTPKWVGKVTASVLNVRTWAGTEFANIKSWPVLKRGNLVDVCDTVKASNGKPWYYIRIAEKYYGFVSAEYIQRV